MKSVKLKNTEILFTLFSLGPAAAAQPWRGLAGPFVKNPD
ncbi:hypothetical protein VK055_1612 [Klebsiella pneumoniae subsp. pneumoniae]|nr:hypothetical protein VK055_1612 [Klebsiella pneumoniae subsp. pneumoniae]